MPRRSATRPQRRARRGADADADATLTRTSAAAKALLLQAEADKQAASLRGVGEVAARKAMVDASRGTAGYVAIIEAEAKRKWSGGFPNVLTVSNKAMLPILWGAQTGQMANTAAK